VIVIGLVVIVMMMMARSVFVMFVAMLAGFAVFVHRQRLNTSLARRSRMDGVCVIVGMIVVIVFVSVQERRVFRLAPEDGASRQRQTDKDEAAGQHVPVKLFAEHQVQHVFLQKPQAKADGAEPAGQSDHAKLIDEIGIAVVMLVIGHISPPIRLAGELTRRWNTASAASKLAG
jgi:uncharacterized membrane protein YcjF (UPF0283 family)